MFMMRSSRPGHCRFSARQLPTLIYQANRLDPESACILRSQAQHCPIIMKPPRSLPLQMAEHLLRAQPDSVAKKCLDFYIIRKNIYLSFLRRRMVGGATPPNWNFGSTGLSWSEIADFEPIIACSNHVTSRLSSINVSNAYKYANTSENFIH